jgi:nucleotide-binding universal stress UspA family protein
MEVGKLLYATDNRYVHASEVEPLLALRTLGLEEVIFLHTTKVEVFEKMLADYGLKWKTLTLDGPMVPGILRAAQREAVSLITTSFSRDTSRPLRSSLTRKLLRASALPVLILKRGAQESESFEKGLFAHVIFATDWSAASEKAFEYLLNLKEIIRELEIVHVVDKKLSVRDMRNLKEKLAQTRKILKEQGIDAESHVYAGKPSEEIMLAAKDYGATCIVMGTTGKSALKDLLSHSCSYHVAEASVVPTLVVC